MMKSMDPKVVAAITHAVNVAIAEVGIDGLLKTSMFPSSYKHLKEMPLAA